MPIDPHGRATRADAARRRRPVDGFRARDRRRFADLVEQGVASLPANLLAPLQPAMLRIEEVPEPTEGTADIPLARFTSDAAGETVLTIYRRPLELRALDRADLVDLVRLAAGRAVADALGLDPGDLDD
jgi:predicted Zn-dependent protease with MMP-like domain